MLKKLKIRIAKIVMGSTLAVVPAASTATCDQSLGQMLDLIDQVSSLENSPIGGGPVSGPVGGGPIGSPQTPQYPGDGGWDDPFGGGDCGCDIYP